MKDDKIMNKKRWDIGEEMITEFNDVGMTP
jgi:hypothetical protein